jgi:hypothetical protein
MHQCQIHDLCIKVHWINVFYDSQRVVVARYRRSQAFCAEVHGPQIGSSSDVNGDGEFQQIRTSGGRGCWLNLFDY